MIYLLVSDDSLFHRMLSETFLQDEEVFSWAGRKRPTQAPPGHAEWPLTGRPFYGDPAEAGTFRDIGPGRDQVVLVCLKDTALAEATVRALSRASPSAKVLVTTTNGELDHLVRDNLRKVSWADMVGDRLETEIARLRTLERVQAVREVLGPAERVALLLQPDPDPDAIASGLALRHVLRRNRATAPLVTFGAVTRPENVAMLALLEIELDVVRPEELRAFDAVALLDVQPTLFRGLVDAPDVVIDHHPEQKGYTCRFRDIRASYGATSTMLTEYCLAAEMPIPTRLATALLYGIKSDTLFLGRETSRADVAAFAHLYPLVNTNLVRRIEKPELPRAALSAFARALRQVDLEDGLACVHMGRVEREDVIPQMAELALQLEGATWSAASGIVAGALVVCVRNSGWQKAAGTVVKAVFGTIGSAGGHQSMAKAVVPLAAFRARYGSVRSARIREIVSRGLREEIQ
ncbi:MAG TPA: DHH family phosphoesterase [Vicinamibacteria bacterium]|nr:DHH family phosphoesterase [Vicinamibacteria bacterium]